jgi:hypothetical protein
MAIRLLPFRQYNEHDVINLFRANDTILKSIPSDAASSGVAAPNRNGNHDNGVLVSIDKADFTKEPVEYGADAYLGKTDYPHIGRNQYPKATPTYKVATDKGALGVALRQTLTHDENGEKMLYYPQKALELNAVLPGQAVPILTRGLITISAAGLGTKVKDATPGEAVFCGKGADAGKFVVSADASTKGDQQVGILIGIGNRDAVGTNPDYFSGDGDTGAYAVIKLGL